MLFILSQEFNLIKSIRIYLFIVACYVLQLSSASHLQATPAISRWDETPGHPKGSETPGAMATPGVSTRMWDPTPGHATPGAVTPGRETPGHDKAMSSRRNRWDETPKTERGV